MYFEYIFNTLMRLFGQLCSQVLQTHVVWKLWSVIHVNDSITMKYLHSYNYLMYTIYIKLRGAWCVSKVSLVGSIFKYLLWSRLHTETNFVCLLLGFDNTFLVTCYAFNKPRTKTTL